MKKQLYDKMAAMFPLVEHAYQEISPFEMLLYRLIRGNTFNMRVVGLEMIKRFRKENPDCAITFKPNHLSEADFIMLQLLFREHDMRVLIEGGDNLFIDNIDIYRDILPTLIHPSFKDLAETRSECIADYLCRRGAFKVFRNPVTLQRQTGDDIKLGRKDILSLSRAYRRHLVEANEMYITFPGYSAVRSSLLDLFKKDEFKTGRSYSGKMEGFHHLPFQMDVEASLDAGVGLYIVGVNVAYERVLEDENFPELLRLQQAGASRQAVYLKDIEYVVRQFLRDKPKANLSIKFAEPRKVGISNLKGDLLGTKIKQTAHLYAEETFEKVMGMQPVFPANIYFTAFKEGFNWIPVPLMREKIDDIRDRLRHLRWSEQKRAIDLHYVTGYNQQLMSPDEIINRTFDLFSSPKNPVTSLDGDTFVVHNREIAAQYRNHISHFFKTPARPTV